MMYCHITEEEYERVGVRYNLIKAPVSLSFVLVLPSLLPFHPLVDFLNGSKMTTAFSAIVSLYCTIQ